MTTQEMLASLEAQIRKDIPRLMELREGCWFINFNGNKHKSLGWYINIENNRVHYSINNKYITYQTEDQMSKIEIIGHDIMLNDVLEWLEYMRKHYDLCDYIHCDVSDKIFQIAVVCEIADVLSLHGFKEECKILKWDLSKLYLKDQSEELIKLLYNLIKE